MHSPVPFPYDLPCISIGFALPSSVSPVDSYGKFISLHKKLGKNPFDGKKILWQNIDC